MAKGVNPSYTESLLGSKVEDSDPASSILAAHPKPRQGPKFYMETTKEDPSIKLDHMVVGDSKAFFSDHGLICRFHGI
jgi:hypothetical protein